MFCPGLTKLKSRLSVLLYQHLIRDIPRVLLFSVQSRPVRRPLAEGGQDFEKLDQNLKFPQIVKKGGKRGNLHK